MSNATSEKPTEAKVPKSTTKATPTPPATLHAKIVQLMGEVKAIEKSKSGPQYKYRGVDDLLAALQPALIKTGLCLSTKVIQATHGSYERIKSGTKAEPQQVMTAAIHLRVSIMDETGSVDYEAVGEGQDFAGDKASNKAMSAAYKYALLQGLCIPTKDVDDSDKEQASAAAAVGNGFVPLAMPFTPAPATVAPVAPWEPTAQAAVAPVAIPVAPVMPATQPLASPTNDPTGISEVDDAIINEAKIEELKAAATAVEIPAPAMAEILGRRGVTRFAELTNAQANEIIAGLRRKQTEFQAKGVF